MDEMVGLEMFEADLFLFQETRVECGEGAA